MIFDQAIMFPKGHGAVLSGDTRHDLRQHHDHFGELPSMATQDLMQAIGEVELTGRGGGHFPVASKLASVLESGAATVVVNGAEGEPLARKDAALLQLRPHLVLDGAQAIARLVRAREVVIWIHAGAEATAESVISACEERERDERYNLEAAVRVMQGPARYLTGEGSAVVAGVRGKDVLPRFITNPARPWVDGEPVLVHNAETHARVGLIRHVGPHDYEKTSLVTLSLRDHLLVVEAPASMTFAQLFATYEVPEGQAVLLGGYGGSWATWQDLAEVCVDPVTVKAAGFSLGAGILRPLLPGESGMRVSTEVLEYLAGESAGQCGPCVFGLEALVHRFERLAPHAHPSSRSIRKVEDIFQLVEGRGACRHPDGAVRMARSALSIFANAGS